LLERTKQVVQNAGSKLRSVIADSQYSSKKLREAVDEAIIPYQRIRKALSRAY
jgi:hypothetical protein